MKSVKSTHSCASKIPRTIPATTPAEKIKSISLICLSPGNYLCASRVGDREGTGEVLSKKKMTVIILTGEEFYRPHCRQ